MYSNTHIHPNREGIKCIYEVEYTDKDEDIKEDYSNLKKLTLPDLEKTIEAVMLLKLRKVYNISLYYCIEDKDGWIIEDGAYNIEQIKSQEDKTKINNLIQVSNNQAAELALYKAFIKQYNAEKLFEQFRNENRI